jgi:hypothetical protein
VGGYKINQTMAIETKVLIIIKVDQSLEVEARNSASIPKRIITLSRIV